MSFNVLHYWLLPLREYLIKIVCWALCLQEMIAASKLHLMAHSVPLRKMLEESEIAEKGTVTLIDIEPETFKNFIRSVGLISHKLVQSRFFRF